MPRGPPKSKFARAMERRMDHGLKKNESLGMIETIAEAKKINMFNFDGLMPTHERSLTPNHAM